MSPGLRIGVCGLGLIGSSVARGLRGHHDVVGLDPDPATMAEARLLGVEPIATVDGFADCDLVVLAAPTRVNRHLLAAFIADGPRVPVADMGSVKAPIEQEWLAGDPSYPFVGTHPMAGSEEAGIRSGSAELFVDAAWPVVVHERTDPTALARVLGMITDLRGLPVPVTAAAHDDAVALASHVPHLLAGVLGNAVAQSHVSTLAILLAAGSFRDATRVSASPPERSAEFLVLNGRQVAREARSIAAALTELADKVAAGDTAPVAADLTRANEVRSRFDNRMMFLEGHQVIGEPATVARALLQARDSGSVVTGFEAAPPGGWVLGLSSREPVAGG